MGGFLRTLARVGLVELEATDGALPQGDAAPPAEAPVAAASEADLAAVDAILADADFEGTASGQAGDTTVESAPGEGSASGETAAPPVTGGGSALSEGRPFATIYAQARVPESGFSAEKMLRVLDGLRAMDPGTRKAAVMAMDAADDEWSVEDSVLDAQRKIKALHGFGAQLTEQVRQAQAQAQQDLEAQEKYRQQATASIRQQMAELEQLLQQELQQVAEKKATIEAGQRAMADARDRELNRLRCEAERLQEIAAIFGGNSEGTTTRPGSDN